MLAYLLQGFLLGLAYVAPIGTQNLYVINAALRKRRQQVVQVALLAFIFDILLALTCFYGIGYLVNRSEVIQGVVLLLGALVVTWIGVNLLRTPPTIEEDVVLHDSPIKMALSVFAVTWLNPQAIIDGSMLLGGMRAAIPESMGMAFMLGVCSASFSWFTVLASSVSIFRQRFSPRIMRWINVICGAIIVFYGLKLGISFIRIITG